MKDKKPYQLIQYRMDRVQRVPKWLKHVSAINVGDTVRRIDAITVNYHGRLVRLGESYTRFSHYAIG